MDSLVITAAAAAQRPAPMDVVDWSGSLFDKIDVGLFGERLVANWAHWCGFAVEPSNDSVFDLRIGGRRAEIKTAKGRIRNRSGGVGHEFYNVYPHTADDFYLVAVDPALVRIFHLTNRQAERALGARHKLTLPAAIRAGAVDVYYGS